MGFNIMVKSKLSGLPYAMKGLMFSRGVGLTPLYGVKV